MNLYGTDPKLDIKIHNLKAYFIEWLKYLIVAIAIIVVAVPEGLPLAVMITLAYSVRKMLIDQNFVKKLASCEIMGGANNICSDKTGTLTMNKMTVTNIFIGVDKSVKINDPTYKFADYFQNENHTNLFKQAIACNTTGLAKDASATEQAMLVMMDRFQADVTEIRNRHLPTDFIRFHFNSKRKRMSTIVKNCGETEHNHDRRVHMKGAAEIVLE
jgi:P-type E1-E2 ATPase